MMTLNKYVFLGIMLASFPTFTTVLAANYNLQPYTTCRSDGFCYTALDISTLGLNNQKMNIVKDYNITRFLNKVGTGFINISYAWNGNTLNVSGWIKPGTNNYWSFNAGADNYDPWWNITSVTYATWNNNQTPLGTANSWTNFCLGPNITAQSTHIDNITKNSTDEVTHVEIRHQNGTLVENRSFVGNVATFSTNVMTIGQVYYIGFCSTGQPLRVTKNYVPYKLYGNGAIFNGCAYATDAKNPTYANDTLNGIFSVQTIVFSNTTTTNTWYTTNFTVNGNANNISVIPGSAVNATAILNVSGLNSTIYRNGTILNSTLANITNTSTLSVEGMYNYTFATNNSDITTYWVDVRSIPYPIDTRICFKTRQVCVDTLTNKVYIGGREL